MDGTLDNISVRSIDVFVTKGRCSLECDSESRELDFSLHRQLSRSVVCVDQSVLGSFAFRKDLFRLSGALFDRRQISIHQLKRIGGQEGGLVELRPWNCAIEIGRQGAGAPICSSFILTGLYEGQFKLALGEWQIELSSRKESELNKKAAKGLGIPLEGSLLRISSDEKSQEQHEKMAADIMLLLSLASGTGVTCHRWTFDYPDNKQLEIWRSRAGDEIGPGPIVEAHDLGDYIEQVFPAWDSMSQEEKRVLSTAITHLNNSGSGYLDNRLFQSAQTWEYLAKQWIPEPGLSEAVRELKDILKKARRKWAKDHPSVDPNGLIGDRISKAFDWPILKSQIEGLATQSGINLSTLGIDIEHLKAARDSVAHSITLKGVEAASGPHFELLLRSQYGLQIILLRRLQYKGLVIAYENGWQVIKHIDDFSAT